MRSDLWILVVLGVLGIAFFLFKFDDSFPAASIDLRTSKSVIVQNARQWCAVSGYKPEGAIESTIFSYDDDAKTFLEYELGQGKANELMKSVLPIWMWRTRFCRAFQQEECAVGILTDGKLAYFDHDLPNDTKLPSLSHAEARKLAESFIQDKVGVSLAGNELIDDSETKQVNRSDHYFNWKQKEPDFNEGKLYTYIYIAGNQVTKFNRYLHVPEKFERKYAKIRAWNNLLKNISSIVYVFLSSAIAFIFVWAFANGRIRWKLVITAAIVAAVFNVLAWFDNWPSLIADYETTISFDEYIAQSVIKLATSTAFAMISALFFVGALEPIYRMLFPEKIAIDRLFGSLGMRTASVFRGLVAGLSVFGIHTAYVVAFYLAGQKLGFWSPLEVRDASTLSRLSPVFESVNVAVMASTTEELMYRVLALALFQKLARGNFWLANFLQAASWAFMHSDYPQEPAYVRGVELTIGGFFYGWVLRRFGLLACVVAHYTYDAFLGVTPLVVSAALADRLQALLAVLPGIVLLAISGIKIARQGVLADETELENMNVPDSAKPAPASESEHGVELAYMPLSRKVRMILLSLCLAGALAAAFVKPQLVGHVNRVTLTRAQATERAAQYLQGNGISTKGLDSVAYLSEQTDMDEVQYVYEKEGFEKTSKLLAAIEPRLCWRVRFFKELSPTEYIITLSGDGQPDGQYVIKDEDAPGGKPTLEQAKKTVDSFLRTDHAKLFPLVLDEEPTRHDLKNRVDYEMNYTAPLFKAGNAEFKVITGTVGGDLSGLSTGWRVPDEWIYERKKQTHADQVSYVLRQLVGGVLGVVALWWLWGVLKAHSIRWRAPIVFGAIAAVATLLHALNQIPSMFVEYSTQEPFQTFFSDRIARISMSMVSSAAGIAFIAAFAYGAFRRSFRVNLSDMMRPILPKGLGGAGSNRDLWLDATIASLSMVGVLIGVDKVMDACLCATSPAVHIYNLNDAAGLTDEWSMSIQALLLAITAALVVPMLVAMAVSMSAQFLKGTFWKVLLAAIVVMAVIQLPEHWRMMPWQDYVWTVLDGALLTVIGYFFVTKVARLNLLTYAMTGFFLSMVSPLMTMIRAAYQPFFGDIAVLIAAALSPLAYTAWLWTSRNR